MIKNYIRFQGTSLLTTGGLQKYYSADFFRWHKVKKKIDNDEINTNNKTMKIVFLGGSMTSGIIWGSCYLNDIRANVMKTCSEVAYPARFKIWLPKAYPNVNVFIYNLAIGGSQSRGLLTIIGDKLKNIDDVDAIFIHYLTNDSAEAVVDPIGLSIAFEDLIRFLLNSWSKQAAIIYIAMLPGN